MKKILLFLLSAVLCTAVFSCDEEQFVRVNKTVSKNKILIYNINNVGTINSASTLYPEEIVRTLADQVTRGESTFGYTVKSLTIQSLGVRMSKNSGNTATAVKIGSFITQSNTPGSTPLLSENNFEIDDTNLILVNAFLSTGGVSVINSRLIEAFKTPGTNAPLNISIKGNTVPANSRAVVQVRLNVTFTIEYSYCEMISDYLLNPFDECVL